MARKNLLLLLNYNYTALFAFVGHCHLKENVLFGDFILSTSHQHKQTMTSGHTRLNSAARFHRVVYCV